MRQSRLDSVRRLRHKHGERERVLGHRGRQEAMAPRGQRGDYAIRARWKQRWGPQ
jgi:hypothetical protein